MEIRYQLISEFFAILPISACVNDVTLPNTKSRLATGAWLRCYFLNDVNGSAEQYNSGLDLYMLCM